MLQFMNQPIQFKIFNAATLNNILLCEILAGSASYLIVLLQFEVEAQMELNFNK